MMPLTLRAAGDADVPVITATIRAAFEEYRGVLNPPSGSHNESEASVAGKLHKGGGIIAYIDDVLAGVVLYYPEDDGSLYLGRLAVLPGFRRAGVAKALVNEVEAQAKQGGYPRISLAVRVQLTSNRQFFERMGYQVVRYDRHPGFTEPTFMHLEKVV